MQRSGQAVLEFTLSLPIAILVIFLSFGLVHQGWRQLKCKITVFEAGRSKLESLESEGRSLAPAFSLLDLSFEITHDGIVVRSRCEGAGEAKQEFKKLSNWRLEGAI